MTKAQETRSKAALERRREDVKKYQNRTFDKLTPEQVAHKLKSAKTEVANLEKKLGIAAAPVSNA